MVTHIAAMLAKARAIAGEAHLFQGAEREAEVMRGLSRGEKRAALFGLARP